MDLSQVTYIGKTDFRNQLTQFGIRAKDRFRHMYIIGKSGTGKTTLMENLIVQDIYNGNGVAFIDPHGESAEKLLKYIPSSRINDVIYFNPSDSEFPIAFNPLEVGDNATASERSLIADGIMTVFKKIWPDAFSGRMEYILNNTMLALLENPDPTLLGINRMLTDKEYRKKVIAGVTDPTVRNAWDELMKWDDKRWSEAIGALVNKVGQFTTNPVIRNIVGQPKSTFSFRQVMDEKKILIMNMSKGLIGDQSATLLGAMLITKIYLAGMSRANMTQEQLLAAPPLYFYVDEFQNFANDSFANILSEARKYKLALTVANQYIAQMEETIRDAVFGNMGTTITFRVGPLDAEFMERVFAPVFTAQDLQNVAFGQIFLTLLIDGLASKPFSANTLLPIEPREEPQPELVVETSRRQFARPRDQVEDKIMNWFLQQRTAGGKDKTLEKPTQNPQNTEPSVSGTGTTRNLTALAQSSPATKPTSIPAQVPSSQKPREFIKNNQSTTKSLAKPLAPVKEKLDQKQVTSLEVKQKTEPKIALLDNLDQAFTTTQSSVSGVTVPVKPPQTTQQIHKDKKQTATITVQKSPVEQVVHTKKQVITPAQNIKQNTSVKKDFSKAAKTDTKKSLADVLARVQSFQKSLAEERKARDIGRTTELKKLLSDYRTSNTQDTQTTNGAVELKHETLEKPLTTHERLHAIFNKSEIVRGTDDLPQQAVVHKPKEVPEDVLQSIFQM